MSYIVLRKDLPEKDDFSSWRKVKFSSRIPKSIVTKEPFKRGDLFAVIKIEHVSDIENNIHRLFVATSNKKMLESPYDKYWFLVYDSLSSEYVISSFREANLLSKKAMITIAYRCAVKLLSICSDSFVKYGLSEVSVWIDGEKNEHKVEQINYDLAEDNQHLSSVNYNARLALANLCDAILSKKPIDGVLASINYTVVAFVDKTRRSYHEEDAEIANFIKSMFPITDVILAEVEKKKLV